MSLIWVIIHEIRAPSENKSIRFNMSLTWVIIHDIRVELPLKMINIEWLQMSKKKVEWELDLSNMHVG